RTATSRTRTAISSRSEATRPRDAEVAQGMKPRLDPRAMRHAFIKALIFELRVVWPVISGLLLLVVVLGVVIGRVEGWSVHESIYFAFVSGLTIGFGDFVPKTLLTRALAIVIGICGVLLVALVAAIAVEALREVSDGGKSQEDRSDDA